MESPAARAGMASGLMRSKMSRCWPRCPSRIVSPEKPGIPIGAFASECVLLPREPTGEIFNAWLRALFRTHGVELDRTVTTASAPWDRRMRSGGERGSGRRCGRRVGGVDAEVVAVPFDPPLSFPTDLASRWPPTEAVEALFAAAQRVRDTEGWLTRRPARSELPED